MFRNALIALILAVPCLLSAQTTEPKPTPSSANDNLYINVGKAAVKKSLAALPPLKFLGTPSLAKNYAKYEKELQDVITKDLTIASYFTLQDPAGFLEGADRGLRPKEIEGHGFDFEAWKSINTEFLIKAGYNIVNGTTVTFDAYVYNVNQRELVFGRSYTAPLKDTRSVGHKFCNDLLEKITGVKPFFLTKLVVGRSAGKNEKEIYMMDWDGANPVAITNSKSVSVSPTWSRDGRYIAYSSFAYHKSSKTRNNDLFLYDLKTRDRVLLSAQRGQNSTATFFPDQRHAIVRISSNNGSADLYKIALDGSGKTPVVQGPRGAMNVEPALSPDGTKLAFSSDRSGKAMIYVHDLTTNSTRRLTFAGQYNASPAWSPDGKRLAFMANQDSHFDIFVIDADGKNLQRLTQGARKPNGRAADNEDPSFSPDGRMILFRSNRTGNHQLYVMTADGKNEYRLTFDKHDYYRPQWSPFLQ